MPWGGSLDYPAVEGNAPVPKSLAFEWSLNHTEAQMLQLPCKYEGLNLSTPWAKPGMVLEVVVW